MQVLAVDVARGNDRSVGSELTIVLLDERGKLGRLHRASSHAELTATVAQLAAGETYVLAVNLPVVGAHGAGRARPVDRQLRRRFGLRHRGRRGRGPSGATVEPTVETLLAGLAAAGAPLLPYPDRDRRQSGLAEIPPGVCLKVLLWQTSPLAASREVAGRAEMFRRYAPPPHRAAELRARTGWAEQAAALDLVLRGLGQVDGFDFEPAREALDGAAGERDVERAGALLDALLMAGTARRYMESPEGCLFLGDRDNGYAILPADSFVRRLAAGEKKPQGGRLFPKASLRERLAAHAQLRAVDLLDVPGHPQRVEATFKTPPTYEFDNLDEMLWWKHCRHLAGVALPTEGLSALTVRLGSDDGPTLTLARSRHRTLSFRYEPPETWRAHVPTRDGRTYRFHVARATYETLPVES